MRSAGILLHISSLPSEGYIGDFGREAYEFIEFLYSAGQSIWHILPLHPTSPFYNNSPYNSLSLFAGNILFINAEKLVEDGFLERRYAKKLRFTERVDYVSAYRYKEDILRKAYKNFIGSGDREFLKFCEENSYWLEEYSFYEAERRGRVIAEEVNFFRFCQYVFFKQWNDLKRFANSKGIKILGDMPIYPAPDSAEVRLKGHLFKLGRDGKPLYVAGVPPDYFSSEGQLWGNPVYDWEGMEKEGFLWWRERFIHALKMYDMVRIDHFRGLVAFWEVPAGSRTAKRGKWVRVPSEKLFREILKYVPACRVVAEDLGYITPDVRELRRKLGFSGMKVLQFAFGEEDSEHLPHNYERNCVVFTGTHDNPPLKQWFLEMSEKERERLRKYAGLRVREDSVCDVLIRLAYMSVADTVIIPLQDVLGLGKEARMNTPGKRRGNWLWRVKKEQFTHQVISYLKYLTEIYGRS